MSYFEYGVNPSVANVGGSSGERYTSWQSKTWIEAWRREAGISNPPCSVLGCGSSGSHGAHVRIQDGRTSQKWAIIPMCPSHNNPNNYDDMQVKKGTRFVRVEDMH